MRLDWLRVQLWSDKISPIVANIYCVQYNVGHWTKPGCVNNILSMTNWVMDASINYINWLSQYITCHAKTTPIYSILAAENENQDNQVI